MQKKPFTKYYEKNNDGRFEYKGKIYKYAGEDRVKSYIILWILFLFLSASSVSLGFLPSCLALSEISYVRVPLVLTLCSFAFFLLTMVKFALAGREIKEYDFRGSIGTLPIAAIIHIITSLAELISLSVYLILNGFGEYTLLYVISLALSLTSLLSGVLFFIKFRKMKWEESN